MTTPDSRAREAAQYLEALTAERDALKEAARLALDALVEIIAMNTQYCIDKYSDSSRAETMSCVITARKAISSLKKIL